MPPAAAVPIPIPPSHLLNAAVAAPPDPDPLPWRLLLFQVALCIVVNFGGISAGANFGFSAVALPEMRKPNSSVPVSEEDASWIAGVSALATPLGCLVSGWLLDRLGRRAALLWQNVPALLGWCLLAAPTLWGSLALAQVYVGRILTGLAAGMSSIPGTVYSAEVGVERLRGLLVTLTSVSISCGIVMVYAMGAALPSWRLVAATCACFPVLGCALVFALVAESPVWLVGRGRAADAQAALMRVRLASHPDAVREELAVLVREHQQAKARNQSSSVGGLVRDLQRPECWKPLAIMNLFFLFQQLSGVFVVIFYAVDVVIEAGVSSNPYLITVLIGVARLVVTVLAGVLSNRVGRRALALASGCGMTASMLLLAWHLWQPLSGPWLSATTLIGFILTSTVGFLTLPWSMIGEVFPAHFRGVAGGFTTCSAYLYSFTLLKLYPGMTHHLSRQGVFLFFGAMSFLGTIFVALCLPETQGRTLQEVQEHFKSRADVISNEESTASELKTLTAQGKT